MGWRGTRGSSVGNPRTDYERACDETEYLGTIPSGSSQALILGDEPLQSILICRDAQIIVVRWVSCTSQARAANAITSLPSQLAEIEQPTKFSLDESNLVMFDAALDNIDMSTCQRVDAEPGSYTVTVERYLSDSCELLVHRFIRDKEH